MGMGTQVHTVRPDRRDDGFTLVELLVVMAVLALLAAIAIPTFFSQTDKARDSVNFKGTPTVLSDDHQVDISKAGWLTQS